MDYRQKAAAPQKLEGVAEVVEGSGEGGRGEQQQQQQQLHD